jgi:uncharacterized glyoxalase superfamily protein PhnB
MAVKAIPEGYHTVTPYLVVSGADRVIEFLKQAFGAAEIQRTTGPDGAIRHAEVSIGDSRLMLGEAGGAYPPMPAMLHLYVEDVDTVYRRAIQAGAVTMREPVNEFYGDRMAGVKDLAGNQWWIATHVEDVSPEEMQRRSDELMQQKNPA